MAPFYLGFIIGNSVSSLRVLRLARAATSACCLRSFAQLHYSKRSFIFICSTSCTWRGAQAFQARQAPWRHRLLNLLYKAIWSVSQPRNLSEMFHRHEALLGSNDEKRVSFGDPYAWLSSRDMWQFCKVGPSTVMINL